MNNEAGDKSPNEVVLSVLIEGEALTLVPLRSICRGGYHPPERRKKKGKRRMVGGTPAPDFKAQGTAAVFDRTMKSLR